MSLSENIIREARPEDLEGILHLLGQLSPPGPGEESDPESGRAILERMINNPDYYLSVFLLEGRLVGTATLLVQWNLSHGGKPYGHVENVVTEGRVRGNGVGRAMVDFLILKARERGCYKVILNCESKNIHFYEQCGFRLTGEVEMRLSP